MAMACNVQVVMRGVLPLDEAIVLYLAFNIVPRILRVIRDLNLSGCRSILLMFSLSYSMVTGARAEPHISETNIQSWYVLNSYFCPISVPGSVHGPSDIPLGTPNLLRVIQTYHMRCWLFLCNTADS
jgi:hypothetical protein